MAFDYIITKKTCLYFVNNLVSFVKIRTTFLDDLKSKKIAMNFSEFQWISMNWKFKSTQPDSYSYIYIKLYLFKKVTF